MRILHVVGTRPNFVKMAPVYRALRQKTPHPQTIVHTGQHYDANMSDVFFHELNIPAPSAYLLVGSGTHAQQTAGIMAAIEPAFVACEPDLVLIYGDVNSTAAAALVAAKRQIPVGHIEAGLRSFDRTMPEEINRVVTDCLADLLFTPSEDGNANLMREGITREKVFLVGNVMIDTLFQLHPIALERFPGLAERFALNEYGLVTLHRPSNVDDSDRLQEIWEALLAISRDLPLLFPVHPRTKKRLVHRGMKPDRRLLVAEPLGYLDFLALEQHAKLVITDSGGVQEETTCLGVACLTIRKNTERPITLRLGTNVLVGCDMTRLQREVERILAGKGKQGTLPPLWDGHAGDRIAEVIEAQARRLVRDPGKLPAIAQ
jgi:UDP-N-acetylglucosamine 2-epimerase (non-hydrolysing)